MLQSLTCRGQLVQGILLSLLRGRVRPLFQAVCRSAHRLRRLLQILADLLDILRRKAFAFFICLERFKGLGKGRGALGESLLLIRETLAFFGLLLGSLIGKARCSLLNFFLLAFHPRNLIRHILQFLYSGCISRFLQRQLELGQFLNAARIGSFGLLHVFAVQRGFHLRQFARGLVGKFLKLAGHFRIGLIEFLQLFAQALQFAAALGGIHNRLVDRDLLPPFSSFKIPIAARIAAASTCRISFAFVSFHSLAFEAFLEFLLSAGKFAHLLERVGKLLIHLFVDRRLGI